MSGPAGPETSAPAIGALAILGLGLIGGSIGMALEGCTGIRRITGWDPDPSVRHKALSRGAVDSISPTAAAAASSADLVVLCAPLPATLPLLTEIAPYLPASAVVTDVGSIKAAIVEDAEKVLPRRFVGGHPMAGSDAHGIEAAGPDTFRNAPWLITPTARTGPEALRAVEALALAVGAVPRDCDPAEHDRIVAALSHLPHLLAYGLAQSAADLVPDEWRNVAAGSFRDGTRVAASDPDLWRAVFRGNRSALLASLDSFDDWTRSAREAISTGDEARLEALLQSARDARRTFYG